MSRGSTQARRANVGQADVNNFDNFDCTNNAFEANKNHQQYMKTCQSNKSENRAFLSNTKSSTGKPPTVPKQRDARSFLIGDFLKIPADLFMYFFTRKQSKNLGSQVMFSALDRDEKILFKMWNDIDSKRKSRDYNALYTQHEPGIKSLIQSVTAAASKPFNT
jgi:hypothetical protein